MATAKSTDASMLRPKRRWLSYSLRALFAVVTVVCVWMAFVTNRAHRQERAVARIDELGGHVLFDYEIDELDQLINNGKPWAPAWARSVLGEEYFRRVRTVVLRGCSPTPDDLDLLSDVPGVSRLLLREDPSVTDDSLRHLAGAKNLRILDLISTSVEGPGLQHIAPLHRLEELWIGRTPLTDEGMRYIAQMRGLKLLYLSDTNVTDAGLANLSALTSLERLQISGTAVTDKGLAPLANLTNLRALDLDRTGIQGSGLRHIAQLRNLEELWLDMTHLTDENLEHLTKLSSLKTLSVYQTEVTDAGVAELQKALPACKISWK